MCGLTYHAYRDAGIGAPIVQFHIDYHRPLMLDDVFIVTASYIWTDALKLNTEFKIAVADGTCACTGFTTQLLMQLENREALWSPPPIWERFTARWRSGEFNG
jgi:acyl-CoA thioesterase FadM